MPSYHPRAVTAYKFPRPKLRFGRFHFDDPINALPPPRGKNRRRRETGVVQKVRCTRYFEGTPLPAERPYSP